jgi:hypothetical protein
MVALTTRTTRFEAEILVNAWARVHRDGSYEKVHSSPGHHWSGLYVVQQGAASPGWPESGVIEFLDPRGLIGTGRGPENPFGRGHPINPAAGTVVIFPGWLGRWMNPYYGKGERIHVAFDARVRNLRMLDEARDGATLQ